MARFEKLIHDFITLFGAQAWVSGSNDLTTDRGYVNFIKSLNTTRLSGLNPFNLDGTPIISSVAAVSAEVVNGVWNVQCASCSERTVVRKNKPIFVCTTCYVQNNVSTFYNVNWRSDKDQVEEILLARPRSENRNALKTENVRKLVEENERHASELVRRRREANDGARGSRGRR